MDAVNKLENTIGGWFKNVPHLPKGGKKWLANNLWWIALISAIIGILGVLILVPAVLIAFTSILAGEFETAYNPAFYVLSIVVSLVSLIATTALTCFAIAPLKAKRKTGWSLIFLSLVVSFVLGVVASVLQAVALLMSNTNGVVSLVTGLIVSIVGFYAGAYFIFEIREYFGKAKTAKKAVTKA